MPHAVVMGSLEQSLAAWASSAGGTLALAPHNIHVAQGGKEEVVLFFAKPYDDNVFIERILFACTTFKRIFSIIV